MWCNIFACYQWITVLYRGDCYPNLWQFKLLTFLHINPLHPNISMHILHTVLDTFPKELMRRICLTTKSILAGDHCPYSHDLNV